VLILQILIDNQKGRPKVIRRINKDKYPSSKRARKILKEDRTIERSKKMKKQKTHII
jgi:hypothetical protein